MDQKEFISVMRNNYRFMPADREEFDDAFNHRALENIMHQFQLMVNVAAILTPIAEALTVAKEMNRVMIHNNHLPLKDVKIEIPVDYLRAAFIVGYRRQLDIQIVRDALQMLQKYWVHRDILASINPNEFTL